MNEPRNQPKMIGHDDPKVSTHSLAFSALMKLDPSFQATPEPQASERVTTLTAVINTAQPPDRWKFARDWIAQHPS